jgi:hypothetical protein
MASNNVLFGFPIFSDAQPLVTPTLNSGSWVADLPLTNLQSRWLAKVARTADVQLSSTRLRIDLKQDRAISCFAIPKHTISTAGKARVIGVPSSLLFDYEPGDDIAALGGTFTRTSIAYELDSGGTWRQRASGVPRDGHFLGGQRYVLLEETRTNSGKGSNLFADSTNWTDSAAFTLTARTSCIEGQTAQEHKYVAGSNWRSQTIGTFVNGQHDCFYAILENVDATVSDVIFWDNTTSAIVGSARMTWATHIVTLTSGVGVVGGLNLGQGRWLVFIQIVGTAAGNGANGNGRRVAIYPTGSAADTTHSCIIHHAQAEIGSYEPTTPIVTGSGATATRAAEDLTFPFAPLPQALTLFTKSLNTGITAGDPANWNAATIATIGPAGVGTHSLCSRLDVANDRTEGIHLINGGAQVLCDVNGTIVVGDILEENTRLYADGSVQTDKAINGAASTTGAQSGALALPANWGSATIRIGGYGAVSRAWAIACVRVMAGTQTFATMQTAVYDSGWVSVWPQVYPSGSIPVGHPSYSDGYITAEDAVGYQMSLVVLPTTAFVGRYWSLQIDDSANAAGYLDLSRLVVAGGYRPAQNLSPGSRLGWESLSQRRPSDGDGASYHAKTTRRFALIDFSDLSDDELLVDPFEIQRRLGIGSQFYFIWNTSDTYHMHRRSFLAVLRELTALQATEYLRGRIPLSVVEEV